ncbi:MAG: putative toxin-antitoxin system toxin component, PIN family [Thermoanaerobaculia bacterium]
MKIVFDTNVIVAGLVARGLCHELIEVHLPLHEPILSAALWDELVAALRNKFRLETQDLPFLDLYHRHASWVEAEELDGPVSRDPDDDWVLATALAGQATLIVTGDDDLLTLGSFQNVEIVTPRQFFERFVSGGSVE